LGAGSTVVRTITELVLANGMQLIRRWIDQSAHLHRRHRSLVLGLKLLDAA
jgi:hypothetical protein